MLLAILSDTHNNHAAIAKAMVLIAERQPDLILHCGDIDEAATVPLFPKQTQFVFGNCDTDRAGIEAAVQQLGGHMHGAWGHVELGGKSIGFVHGDDATLFRDLLQSQSLDYLFHGHTHLIRDERQGRTRIINPGALYRAKVKTFAFLEPERDCVEWVEVC